MADLREGTNVENRPKMVTLGDAGRLQDGEGNYIDDLQSDTNGDWVRIGQLIIKNKTITINNVPWNFSNNRSSAISLPGPNISLISIYNTILASKFTTEDNFRNRLLNIQNGYSLFGTNGEQVYIYHMGVSESDVNYIGNDAELIITALGIAA